MQPYLLFTKIKCTCFLTGFISFVTITNGNPVDSITAKTVAVNFYALNCKLTGTIHESPQLVYTEKSSRGEAEYYVYNMRPQPPIGGKGDGFVIVSADDAAHPILGYSAEGYYSLTHIPPAFAFWMQKYKKQIEYIRLHNFKASVDIQNEWSAFRAKNEEPRVKSGVVAPLVKTVWAQSPYYNSLCPDGDVAGCIATAMGQIMKYWAYPPHGLGSNSYKDNSYGTLYANFDTSQYNWADMPLNVTRSNPSVATLMYDCGVSVDMRYSPNSSGSFMINGDSSVSAQSAFVQYFGYSPSIQGLYRSNYSYASWIALLINELTNNRPLMYAGQGNQGAHAWVCDGYDASGDFHMNWGWAGYEDGYYNLNALNPANTPLDSDEQTLIGIQPAPVVAYFGAYPLIIRTGETVKFTDYSIGTAPITNWQWSFPGGTTTASTVQNPAIIYNTVGTYNVSETITNSEGSNNTLTQDNYIIVLENNTVNVYPALNDGTFSVELHDPSLAGSNLEFSLYDMLGQKVFTTTLVQYITPLTVPVSRGMYFYRAYDSSGKPVSTGKLAIMK